MPVSRSPARIARSIGAAPRQRGSSEACRLTQPSRGRVEHRARQQQAVGADHREVRRQGGELRLGLRVLAACVACDLQSQPFGRLVHGRSAELMAAAGGPRRLGVDGGDLVAGVQQRLEAGQNEAGRAHDHEAQAFRHAPAGS